MVFLAVKLKTIQCSCREVDEDERPKVEKPEVEPDCDGKSALPGAHIMISGFQLLEGAALGVHIPAPFWEPFCPLLTFCKYRRWDYVSVGMTN